MPYFAPYIDETGFHIPTYPDLLNDLIVQTKGIFGQDIYLEPDSQDYEFISIFASKTYDAFLAAQSAYNARSPKAAIGAALDGLVKLNGIRRNPQNMLLAYSTCPVVLNGVSGTVINSGIVQDVNGHKWNVASPATIGLDGTVIVTATCQESGPILADVGEINIIVTPMAGWISCANLVKATPGIPVETNAQLRSRQSISTAQPSLTVLEGLKGAIAAISGVTRSTVLENDTAEADANGLPPKSVTAIVEGGTDEDVAYVIFRKKGPGCYTNGTISVNIVDLFGQANTVRFYRPTYVDFDVVINVKALSGYTSEYTALIKSAIKAHLDSFALGGSEVLISSLWGAALSVQELVFPVFSITSLTAAKHGESQDTVDIPLAFNEIARGNVAYITVNVT
jgi:uncharacterized phage protein gp47/JayE